MKVTRVEFTKKQLENLSEDEAVFVVQVSHFINEIMILEKCIIYSMNSMKKEDDFKKYIHMYQTVFFLKVLAGKLHEGWGMLEKSYFGAQLSKKYDSQLRKEAKDYLDEIKKYFSNENLIHTIRTKYAFHYDRDQIKNYLDNISDEEDLNFIFSRGNYFFGFSEHITNFSLLHAVDKKDYKQAIESIVQEVLRVSLCFQAFGQNIVMLMIPGEKFVDFKLSDIPNISNVLLPYFVER